MPAPDTDTPPELPLGFGSRLKARWHTVGAEQNPVLIIDDFIDRPERLISIAESGTPFSNEQDNFYPGERKPAPSSYTRLLREIVDRELSSAGLGSGTQVDLSVYSLVTTPVAQLRPIQCVPHIDTHQENCFAAVHYLCSSQFGGTSFYRHRSTGHESIDEYRLKPYFATLKQEVMAERKQARGYINGSNELFERIGQVEQRFNRLIVYRGNCLHAGDIDPDQGLSDSPREGRLTVNSFMHLC